MLTWAATKRNYAKVYSYKRCIWSVKCRNHDEAIMLASDVVNRLNAGDLNVAIKVGLSALANSGNRINVALGPHYSINVASRQIINMQFEKVATI